jgi:hypothetical protein
MNIQRYTKILTGNAISFICRKVHNTEEIGLHQKRDYVTNNHRGLIAL